MMRACKKCGVRWPAERRFKSCPGCGEETTFDARYLPDADWEDRLLNAQMANSPMPSVEARQAAERLSRFQEAGLDLGTAMEFAGDYTVDLGLFEKIRREGCPLALAIEIVSPLSLAG